MVLYPGTAEMKFFRKDVDQILEISEVRPDTPSAVRVVLARLSDGNYTVWKEYGAKNVKLGEPLLFTDEKTARENFQEVVDIEADLPHFH